MLVDIKVVKNRVIVGILSQANLLANYPFFTVFCHYCEELLNRDFPKVQGHSLRDKRRAEVVNSGILTLEAEVQK